MKLLTLSALLLSTTILAVHADYKFELVEDITQTPQGKTTAKFRITPQGTTNSIAEKDFELDEFRLVGFEKETIPHLQNLDPLAALPQDLGHAKKRMQCTFTYDGKKREAIVTLPTLYPLQGKWDYQEDRKNKETIPTLILRTSVEDQIPRMVDHIPFPAISFEFIKSDDEVLGDYCFDPNLQAYRKKTIRQIWKKPDGKEHQIQVTSYDGEIPSHKGNKVIYVEPFLPEGDLTRHSADYIGTYRLEGDLSEEESLKQRDPLQLFYSDGTAAYLPHVTQEQWVNTQDREKVNFFIASINENRKINFLKKAIHFVGLEAGTSFPSKGFYQLLSVEQEKKNRKETWRRLGEQSFDFTIKTPWDVSSVPGMGVILPYEIPNYQSGTEVTRLQKDIREIVKMTKGNKALSDKNAPSIILLGPARIGKSMLIHHMSGSAFTAERRARGWNLIPTKPIDGLTVRYGSNVGTTLPNFWYDEENNQTYWDCPGLDDPRGPYDDIINAFAIEQVFNNVAGIKVILTVPERAITGDSLEFIKYLDRMGQLFPKNGQDQFLSLAVTQQERYEPKGAIQETYQDVQNGSGVRISTMGRRLLKFFAEHPERISSFPSPTQVGNYDPDNKEVVASIARSSFIPNPNFSVSIGSDSKLLVNELGGKFNKYISDYMHTEGARRIFQYCRKKIDDFSGSIATLRAEFASLAKRLEGLVHISADHPKRFAKGLEEILGDQDLRQIIGHLKFLKNTLRADVTFQTDSWGHTLLKPIKRINELATAPKLDDIDANGTLTLKGTILGTSDIAEALKSPKSPIRTIKAFALNTLFIDEDVTARGADMVLAAADGTVDGKRTINLRGADGAVQGAAAAGADGEPGNPGGNGGHLYFLVDRLEGVSDLTLDISGGDGGTGQKGGNGTPGTNGTPGSQEDLENFRGVTKGNATSFSDRHPYGEYHAQKDQKHWQVFGTHHDCAKMSGTESTYTHGDNNATSGGNGGNGGLGGLGGHKGSVLIESATDTSSSLTILAVDGTLGSSGDGGAGGPGGTKGPVWTGIYITGMSGKYDHKYHSMGFEKHEDWECYKDDHWKSITHSEQSSASSGDAGTKGGNQKSPSDPADETTLDTKKLRDAYEAYYLEEAGKPEVSPWMKVFPGLKS